MPKILAQWKKDNITFDAFYTGYLSRTQIAPTMDIMNSVARDGALRIVDPAMADNGKLYAGFDADFPKEMAKLCKGADFILPNLTEASFLLGIEYKGSGYDKAYIETVCKDLAKLGAKNVIITGVSFEKGKLGVAVYNGATFDYYFTEHLDASLHGTGDIYSSAFAGSLMRGKSVIDAASIAADFVVESIKQTLGDKDHWYGAKFEKALPYLVQRLN